MFIITALQGVVEEALLLCCLQELLSWHFSDEASLATWAEASNCVFEQDHPKTSQEEQVSLLLPCRTALL